jgi:hypothetical protein
MILLKLLENVLNEVVFRYNCVESHKPQAMNKRGDHQVRMSFQLSHEVLGHLIRKVQHPLQESYLCVLKK